ncbi:hypothetical protein BKA65DRAFT_473685 [Rhexocercosporidium sp. MPI-PUGE-AT-0058]|nr:hypothetical protein BKA65DRAFT_473685 [Rhexocercosporidium sp. MPI-PUGE-AT-0058]
MTTGRRRTRPPPRANLLWTLRFQLRNQDISMWGAGGALGHMFKRFNLMSDRRDEKQLIEASRRYLISGYQGTHPVRGERQVGLLSVGVMAMLGTLSGLVFWHFSQPDLTWGLYWSSVLDSQEHYFGHQHSTYLGRADERVPVPDAKTITTQQPKSTDRFLLAFWEILGCQTTPQLRTAEAFPSACHDRKAADGISDRNKLHRNILEREVIDGIPSHIQP